jgi:alpha-tubulin suppressor-like RCC1 family protein
VHVAAGGGYHAHALDAGGDAWSWGLGGETGDGTYQNRTTPVRLTPPQGAAFAQIDAGHSHTLARDTEGRTWAWGGNGQGELGDGTTQSRIAPVMVDVPAGTTFTHVSAGFLHSLAIDEAGHAWGWGRNLYGQLGDGSTTARPKPVPVTMPAGVRFTTVVAGDEQSAALDEDGAIWVWGLDLGGVYRSAPDDAVTTPVRVDAPAGLAFQAVDVFNGGVAIDENGNAWDLWWSYFSDDFAGYEALEPVPMPSNPDGPGTVAFTQVAVSNDYRLALDEDGRVWAWGWNWAGQLGDGSFEEREDRLDRVALPEGVTITHIAVGNATSFALDTDGDVWAWGDGDSGILGTGTTTDSATPVRVQMP